MGDDGYWRSAATGRVVFGHSYNKLLNIFNGTELITRDGGNDGGDSDGESADAARVDDAAVDALALTHASRLRQLTSGLGANLATCHLSPERHLLPDLTLNVSAGPIQKCLTVLSLARRHPEVAGIRTVVLLTNELPEWASSLHPDVSASYYSSTGREHASVATMNQHSVGYDIDHPQALVYMRAALSAAARLFGCHEALDSWVLAK